MSQQSHGERVLIGRVGGLTTYARHGGRAMTAAACAAGPLRPAYWEARIDPEGKLPPAERASRAQAALRAFQMRNAAKSVAARRRNRDSREEA